MHRKISLMLIALLWPTVGLGQSLEWARFNLADGAAGVDLPVQVFSVDAGASPRGAGRTFTTADGRADVSLYSIANQPPRSPAQFLEQEFRLPQSSATYRRVTGNMLVVSGFRGDQIYYARCNFGRLHLTCAALNYPANEKRRWDAIVTRISRSLSKAS